MKLLSNLNETFKIANVSNYFLKRKHLQQMTKQQKQPHRRDAKQQK
jgi:hypothetical protein